jgi:hypothetical protein
MRAVERPTRPPPITTTERDISAPKRNFSDDD